MRTHPLTAAIAMAITLANLGAGAAAATEPAPLTAAQWRQDLQVLAAELPRIHPNPFHKVSATDWNAAVAALNAHIPQLTRNQVIVELMRLVAGIGEGHTALNPLYRPELGFHYLPIRPYLFADGLYVRAAATEHASLVGARILRIGNASAEEAFRAVAAVVPHDNDSGAKNAVPYFLVMPEILDGLGIAPAGRAVPFELEEDGRRFTAALSPAGVLEVRDHGPFGSALPTRGWIDAREQVERPAPLALSRADIYWTAAVPEGKTFYIQYNAVVDAHHGAPIATFFPRAIAEAEASGAEKLVIDVRGNGGGNSFLNRPIVKSVIRSRFDRRGHLFVVIGRGTFSAAQNFVNDMARWTNALFVGEPTASNPNQYGDHEPVVLPHSGLVVMVSTLFHQAGPKDRRQWTAPDLPAEPTFAQYRDGVDPALDAVLGYRSLVEALEPALQSGDATAVTRVYRAFKADPATAAIPTEVEINSLGYRLLNDRRLDLALEVFRLNAATYPQSANVHDSLGEAYLLAGDHARAAESYRRVLELDPHNENARKALAHLGGTTPHP